MGKKTIETELTCTEAQAKMKDNIATIDCAVDGMTVFLLDGSSILIQPWALDKYSVDIRISYTHIIFLI